MSKTVKPAPAEELKKVDAYWRAANYLAAAQLYLLDNPLLREPLAREHIKKKIVGHWGTVPGQNFVYAHLNRVIKKYDLDMILLSGPGHGGNFFVANSYLEGTYSEVYPNVGQDYEGMKKLCKQFSFPGGISSHVAPETPGSINEGGELGYSIAHAFGAVFDNPDLIAAVTVGDGEAETGPLATAWHSNKFLNPASDGAVLPILHLNGYKINNPTVLARRGGEFLPRLRLEALLCGGRRSHAHARKDGGSARQVHRRDQRHSEKGAQRQTARPPLLADDRTAHAQGLDGPQGSGRIEDRKLLPRAPSAHHHGQARAYAAAQRLAAEL